MKKQYISLIFVIIFFVFCIVFSSSANDNIYMIKGIRAEEKGEYNEAIKNYKKVLYGNPNFIDLYSTIGRIYRFKLKDNNRAIKIYLKGLKIEPYNFDLNRSLMYIYFSQNKIEDGIKQYLLLSNIRGEKNQYSFPRDTLQLIFGGKTRDEKFIFCKKYLAINPNDVILKEILATIYMEKKDYIAAKREYQSMIESKNETGYIYFSIGVCDYYLGLYKDSLRSFNKAKELGSYVPQNYFDLINEKMSGKSGT